MMLERRSRGQPVLFMGLMLVSWVGARAFAWEHALNQEKAREQTTVAAVSLDPGVARDDEAHAAALVTESHVAWHPAESRVSGQQVVPLVAPMPASAPLAPDLLRPAEPEPRALLLPPADTILSPLPAPAPVNPGKAIPSERLLGAAGHQALWMAATALLPLPPLALRAPTPRQGSGPVPAPRWSGDAWLLLRRNPERAIVPGRTPGTYGASQAGAVIRFRLDTTSALQPTAYLRGSLALGSVREHEAALGLSARPLAQVPVVAMAEARAIRSGREVTRVRPAVALVTELTPQKLPLGFTGEVYAQGGWIGGRLPGLFIDGLARAERPIAKFGDDLEFRAGAGAWGASQRATRQQLPVARVDIGPVASLGFRLTDTARARLEADWRFRVAGSARPGSGPALTLSAGF